MIVLSPPLPGFTHFLEVNRQFWTARTSQANSAAHNGYVLVDLLHNNGTVLLLNLLLARYLAEFLGAKVAAFVAPTFTGHDVPMAEVEDLARSFGVERIFRIDANPRRPADPPGDGHWFDRFTRTGRRRRALTDLRRTLSSLKGAALRRAMIDMTIEDLPVGGLVYDSYLDVSRMATIECHDSRLDSMICYAGSVYEQFDKILREENIWATIVSHPVYVEYGIPLRLSLKHNVPVFSKVWLDPIGVRRFDRLDQIGQFSGTLLDWEVSYFREHLGKRLTERANAFFPPHSQKEQKESFYSYGYGDDKAEVAPKELVDLLAIDPHQKTCLIMAHQFTDCPHAYPDFIFDDYHHWIEETLRFAAKHPGINWLIRQHPYEVTIGETEFFEKLMLHYVDDQSNIKLVPNTITTSSLFSCVDVLTTVAGSSGLEFAAVGIPCILAGNPFYGDLDFMIRPPTQEAYFAALLTVPTLGRLTAEQIARAKEAALIQLRYKRVSSHLVPFIMDLGGRQITAADIDAYWEEATARLDRNSPEGDPLYRHLRRMLDEGRETIIDYAVS